MTKVSSDKKSSKTTQAVDDLLAIIESQSKYIEQLKQVKTDFEVEKNVSEKQIFSLEKDLAKEKIDKADQIQEVERARYIATQLEEKVYRKNTEINEKNKEIEEIYTEIEGFKNRQDLFMDQLRNHNDF